MFYRILSMVVPVNIRFAKCKILNLKLSQRLCKKCPYSELFLSGFFPHFQCVRMRENAGNTSECGKNPDQNNSEYGHFLRSECFKTFRLRKDFLLTNFRSMFHLYDPWTRQKSRCFEAFSGCMWKCPRVKPSSLFHLQILLMKLYV